jgi:hypothetical protein
MSKNLINDITLCFTMGGRPDLLEQSIDSIQAKWNFQHVIAVNDFADPVCDEVFRWKFPQGILLSDGQKRGHHGAVDWMYQHIQTDYVFHTEDDWIFPEDIAWRTIQDFLEQEPRAVSYCFRYPGDFLDAAVLPKARQQECYGVGYMDLSATHEEWYSYSFNPHLIKTATLQRIGAFSQHKKERHISRVLKKQDCFVAYADRRLCEHIGEGMSVANPHAGKPKSALRLWLRKQLNRWQGG